MPSKPRPKLSVREQIDRWATENEVELIFFEPPSHFDHAIVGVVHGYGQEPAVVYDQDLVLAALVKDGMTPDEAQEWFEFNTIGAYLGEATPRFLTKPWVDEEDDDVEEA